MTTEEYIVNPGELSWQDVKDPAEKWKAYNRQRYRMWVKLHPGRRAEIMRKFREEHSGYFVEAMKKFHEEHPGYNTEKLRGFQERHPGYFADARREFNERHPGRQAEIAKIFYERHPSYYNDYHKTPRGKARVARYNAKRRELSTDNKLYGLRIEMLHTLKEPCARCGTPYKTTHQIDHILALSLGGADIWDNYQPLCFPKCHSEKSKEDLRKFLDVRRNSHAIMSTESEVSRLRNLFS